jgi:Lrp/AsnC family transcriptional regulator, regulator for asnA, asnC and gidA
MKMTGTNIEIIKHLREGRKSFNAIAADLSLSENTVRSRVAKMIEEGILDISALVNPEAIPGHRLVLIGVKLDTMDLVKKGEEFSRLHGVISVCVVTGRFDLIVSVLLKQDFGLLEFYTNEVSRIKDVQSVETFVVYKGYNAKVPYVL